MSDNPQEHESTIDAQRSIAQKSLDTHNGCRPSQNPPVDWAEIDRVMNGDLRK